MWQIAIKTKRVAYLNAVVKLAIYDLFQTRCAHAEYFVRR